MEILGQDVLVIKNQILALIYNILSWLLDIFPFFKRRHIPPSSKNVCVVINGPGGLDQLQFVDIPKGAFATIGYNLKNLRAPFARADSDDVNKILSDESFYDPTFVLVRTSFFSVNYADVTIRWGLYESALRYIGWPIVPGFDFSGKVVWAGSKSGYVIGDTVFGFTLFGAYSSQILVPAHQIRLIPKGIGLAAAAGLPAVAGTALHAVSLAGGWPQTVLTRNKAVLIHSGAGIS
jgi:synaptic vesicle membrane protein VAT-1